MREVLTVRYRTMPKDRVRYEQFAWWLTRQEIGQKLRKRYQAPKDLPGLLLRLVRRIDEKPDRKVVEPNQHKDEARAAHRRPAHRRTAPQYR
jgi:hypothetical protein